MSIAGREWTAEGCAIVDARKLWQKRERRRLEGAYRKVRRTDSREHPGTRRRRQRGHDDRSDRGDAERKERGRAARGGQRGNGRRGRGSSASTAAGSCSTSAARGNGRSQGTLVPRLDAPEALPAGQAATRRLVIRGRTVGLRSAGRRAPLDGERTRRRPAGLPRHRRRRPAGGGQAPERREERD